MPKTKHAAALRDLLVGHVMITDHLQNLGRAHGDVEAHAVCSCGAVLGRVVPGETCFCGHPSDEHRKPHLGGCQHAQVLIRTVPETDSSTGLPTGRTIDVVERGICDCAELRTVPASIPRRGDLIDTWLKHAGLPDVPVRDHLLIRVVGTYVPPGSGPAAPSIAHCLCGDHLIAQEPDITDAMAAIRAWAAHVEEQA